MNFAKVVIKKIIERGFFTCLLFNFFYLFFQGCADPQDLITPTHFTRVPSVTNLQAATGYTPTGKRLVLVSWHYDTLNANIRSWDVTRNVNDTSIATFIPLQIVRKPDQGYPSYADTSGTLQTFVADSVELYYRIIPNGGDNFVGPPSDILHVIVRKNF